MHPQTTLETKPMSEQAINQTAPSLTWQLLHAAQRQVDTRTRQRAVLHWLDWMGCVAAGARSPVGLVLQKMQLLPGAARYTPSLLGMAQDSYQAMLMDAGPANVEEMDDMHRQAILHPGPVIMPVLASLSRSHRLSAARTLDAVVRGYEVMIRVGRAVGAQHYYYWHNTATAGVYGAAAACADALQLPLAQAVWALGNAGTQAAGLWQVRLEPVMSKQLHTAHASWAGMTAATLAFAGFTGPQFILEGERGFFAAMCPGANLEIVNQSEPDWLIHGTSFKPWAACRHTHATIDCVLALRQQMGDQSFEFSDCVVTSFNDALSICDKPQPQTRTEAKFSLQYCVAAAAQFGPLQPQHFDNDVLARLDLQHAARKVRLEKDEAINAAYPAHYGAKVVLHFANGQTLGHSVTDALGDPERPLSPQAIFDKAQGLMAYGGVNSERIGAALQAALLLLNATFDETPDVMAAPFPAALLDPLL